MCNNTKGKIADAVEELICTQPGGKVTVQQVMELTQMNRQSFYYHFQDINDVLRRIVIRRFCVPMEFDPAEDPEVWCRRGLNLMKEQKTLLRRISRELGSGRMYELLSPVFRPQVERLIPPKPNQDRQQRELAVDAISYSMLCTATGMLMDREQLDVDATMVNLRAVLATLGVKL